MRIMIERMCVLLLIIWGMAAGYSGIILFAWAEDVPTATDAPPETVKSTEPVPELAVTDYLWQDFTGPEGLVQATPPPEDPCLPPRFLNWREKWFTESSVSRDSRFTEARIIIDRAACRLILQGIRPDTSVQDIYSTPVAMGDFETPTPVGLFFINHVYCYSDVLFFDVNQKPIRNLYNGFFAPLLACDEGGNCRRFRDLGIHGFDAQVFPNPQLVNPETEGFASHGCIRLPNPCAFKAALIDAVGVGRLRRNERGSYHWLSKPVEVWIVDDETTLLSLMEDGLFHVGRGLKGILNWIVR